MPILSEGAQNWKLVLDGELLAIEATDRPGPAYYLLHDFLHTRDTVYKLYVLDREIIVEEDPNPEGEVWNYLEILQDDGAVVHVGLTEVGRLFTFVAKTAKGPWVAGQIYPRLNGSYPTPIQAPDSLTVTMPYQEPDAKTGKWLAGCGHGFNTWEVKKDFFDGAPVALLCCPVCGFIERLFVPYDSIHDEVNMQIFA